MTRTELEVLSELTYIANEIAYAMAARPELSAQNIAGDISDADSELARLARAIKAARAVLVPEAA